jgi:small subunit ribosomal protein S21
VTGPAGRRVCFWQARFSKQIRFHEGRIRLQVVVRDNNVDQALRALKKKLQREGVFREMKLRNYYEKPSEKKARQKAEAVRRARKLARKRAQREGGLPAAPAAGAAPARPARPERA